MPSLVVNGRAEPFAHVLERSAALAERLEGEVGLRSGDRLIVALENSGVHIEVLLASWRLGLQFIAVPPTVSRPTFAGIIETLSPRAVVCDEGNERLGRVALDWASPICALGDHSPDRVLVVGRARPSPQRRGVRRPDSLGSAWQERLAHLPPAVFYTSGSTATAKGVPLAWHRILEKAKGVLGCYDVKPGDRVMPILPLSHVYGLYCLLGALAEGADAITYRESASPAALAQGLTDHAATVVICPPIVGAFLFGRHGAEPAVRDRLRVLSMGGAATSPEQAERILRALPRTRVFLSYGLAETYSTISCNEVSQSGGDVASVGPLRFGAFGEARDPATGLPVPRGETGELCVGGTIMNGYVDAPVDAFTPDGLFRTGDLVRFDRDGAITITGRLKEMINAGGTSISPSEVEETLKQHPAVLDCGVFGERAGDLEVACAAVLLRHPSSEAGHEGTLGELYDHCRTYLAPKMVPRRILMVDRIPRGSLGKIAREELRALCCESHRSDLNRRPLDYESRALPLSYGGAPVT
jgi:acyl-coenzyme A synthetase/AMP-(fatty) acid ligase